MKRLFRYVGMVAGAVLVAAWFYWAAFDNTVVNWPRSPQPELGRIIAYPVKGIVVYITEADRTLMTWLTRIATTSLIVLFAALFLSGEWRNIGPPQSK